MDDQTPRTLCIVVRGWTDASSGNPLTTKKGSLGVPQSFVDYIGHLDGVEVQVLALDMELFSTKTPKELAREITEKTNALFKPEIHKRLVFIGYSAGGPLLRYALMRAHGMGDGRNWPVATWRRDDTPIRVLYLAGILRGWELSTAIPDLIRFLAPPLLVFAKLYCGLKARRAPFITHLRRGAPFVVEGRLMQIDLQKENGGALPFEQIQFLGTSDEFISPSDCIELGGDVSKQLFMELKSTNHHQMLVIDPDQAHDTAEEMVKKAERAKILRQAILGDFEEWRTAKFLVGPDDLNDYFDDLDRPHSTQLSQTSQGIKKAVIILHGIRDNGFWTKRIARKLKSQTVRLRAPSPSYGFFSLWDFAWRSRRDSQTRWFMDQYTNVRECYPAAAISFVGHSNGTYLAAHAIYSCPAIKFDRIVFAGSVVRTDFTWHSHQDQVKNGVLNLKGTQDHVVSLLPGAMQRIGLWFLNVGGAGFHGFTAKCPNPSVQNVLVPGGHRAVVSEPVWSGIAQFVESGHFPVGQPAVRPRGAEWIGRWSAAIFALGLGAILALLGWLVTLVWSGATLMAVLAVLGLFVSYVIFRHF